MLISFFLITPRIQGMKFKKPMMIAFAGYVAAQTLLVNVPDKSYILLMVDVIIEACCFAILGTQVDRMLVVSTDAKERARVFAILFVIMLGITSPFGWIGGRLSEINRIFPFLINICLYICGFILTFLAARYNDRHPLLSASEV